MTNLFIALTPYHVLLAHAVAVDFGERDENVLVCLCDFGSADVLLRVIELDAGSPFSSVVCLPGVYAVKGTVKKALVVRNSCRSIDLLVARLRPHRIYVFNDRRPESQVALYRGKAASGAVGVYVEDGANAYSSFSFGRRHGIDRFAQKLVFGPWREDVDVLGTSRWVEKVLVLFPELIRRELRNRPVDQIGVEALYQVRDAQWPYWYSRVLGVQAGVLTNVELLFLPSSPSGQRPRLLSQYTSVVAQLAAAARERGLKVAVKGSPGLLSGGFFHENAFPGAALLPHSLPAELIYILWAKRVRIVVGDFSTALLTARLLLPGAAVYSIAPLVGDEDPYLFEVFRRLNIRLVDDNEDILQLIW
jgi:hypothetical protein